MTLIASASLRSGQLLRTVGPLPSADQLLVCALLYSACPTVVQIAEYVDADADMDEHARRTYCATLDLARQNISPAPQLVLDELRRTGQLDRQTACWLASATTAAAPPETARRYAAVVVANSLRRQVNSWATTLISIADTASEEELETIIDRVAHTIATTFARLAALRGDSGE
jgi:replicative DNA helicase